VLVDRVLTAVRTTPPDAVTHWSPSKVHGAAEKPTVLRFVLRSGVFEGDLERHNVRARGLSSELQRNRQRKFGATGMQGCVPRIPDQEEQTLALALRSRDHAITDHMAIACETFESRCERCA